MEWACEGRDITIANESGMQRCALEPTQLADCTVEIWLDVGTDFPCHVTTPLSALRICALESEHFEDPGLMEEEPTVGSSQEPSAELGSKYVA